MRQFLPVEIAQIVAALEREAGNTDTDPRWIAASTLRQMSDWQKRTLMCHVDTDPKIDTVTMTQ